MGTLPYNPHLALFQGQQMLNGKSSPAAEGTRDCQENKELDTQGLSRKQRAGQLLLNIDS